MCSQDRYSDKKNFACHLVLEIGNVNSIYILTSDRCSDVAHNRILMQKDKSTLF
jgi:hypothetical protein